MSDENLIWTELKREELFKTPVYTVMQTTSRGPDGQEGNYIVTEAPDWVIVIPEFEDSFLMVKQWRHGERSLSIEFPGGVAEKDENFEEAARRELREETGAEAGKMTLLGVFNPNPALFSNHVHVYLAQDLTLGGSQNLDKDEFVNFMKIKKQEAYALLGTKQAPHALMLSALALYLVKNL